MQLFTKPLFESLTTRLQHRGLFKTLSIIWLTLILTISPILPSLDPLILIGSNTSRASIITWDGEAGDSLWSNPLNWDADRLPQADEVARFAPDALALPTTPTSEEEPAEGADTQPPSPEASASQAVSNVSVDVDVAVGGIEIDQDFVGTVGTNNIELTVGSHGFRQSGGRFISRTSRFDLNGSLTLTDGIFIAPESTMNISGHLNITTDHFQHNRGTITLDGFNQLLFGSATFYNLTKTTQIAQSLDIQSNSTFVIDNTLKLKGTIQQPLTVQTTKSDPAFLEPKGPTDLSYLHVNNLINLSPNTVACTTCTKDNATSGWNIATEADSKAITDRIAELFGRSGELVPTPSLEIDGEPQVAGDYTERLVLATKEHADFASDEDITFTLDFSPDDTSIKLVPAEVVTETGLPADVGENEVVTVDEAVAAIVEEGELSEEEKVSPEDLDVRDETESEATEEPLDAPQGEEHSGSVEGHNADEEVEESPSPLSLFFGYPVHAEESLGADGPVITAQILDFRDEPTDITPTVTEVDGETIIHVDAPTTTFRPGKYTLRVEATIDGRTITQRQDFTWGVLAMNSSKSTYTPGDTMDIGMAVLDDEGHTLCNADLILTITDPAGTTETKTTEPYVEPTDTDEDGDPIIPEQPEADIARSSECGPRTVTNTPDYTTELRDTIEGTYQLHLTATTENGTRILERDVLVTDTEPFTVTRNTATRIWPGADYEVQLHITATQPFIGDITESVPSVFEITAISSNGEINSPDTTIADPTDDPEEPTELETLEDLLNGAPINASDSPTQLTWTNQAISPDQPLTLTYTYNPPDISPQFYLAGPLELQATDASAVGGPSEEILVEATDTAVNGEAGSTNQEDEITTENSTTADTPENSPEPSPEAEVEVSPSPEATISPSPEVLGDTDESEVFPTPAASISPSPDVITDVITSPSPSSTPSPTAEPTVTPTPTTTPETSPNPSSSPQPSPTALVDEPEPAVAITTVISSWIEPRQWQIASDATITISGVCKDSDQTTNCGTPTVRWALNGSLDASTDTVSSGTWSFASETVNTNDVVTVFLDGVADANEAVAVGKYDGSGNMTNFQLYEDHLTIGSDNSTTVNNSDLGYYDNSVSGDEDVFHDSATLLAWWKFDEGSGTTANDSSDDGTWDGSFSGTPAYSNGSGELAPLDYTNDYSLEFVQADTDYIDIDNGAVVTGYPFTMAAWVNTQGQGADAIVGIYKSSTIADYWSLDRTSGEAFQVTSCQSATCRYATGPVSVDGEWAHIVGVFTSSTDRALYVNGTQRATSTLSNTPAATVNRTWIGRFGDSTPTGAFDGFIDDVRIYDQALSASQVQDLFYGNEMVELTVDSTSQSSTEELYVKSSNTYRPRGTVRTHDIEIDGTLDMDTSDFHVTGSWDNDGTTTEDTSTVTFTSTSDESIDTSGATADDFYNVTVNDGSLIGYWKFDETSGNIATDSSGHERDVVLENMEDADWTTDVPDVDFSNNRALDFDGTSERVDIGEIGITGANERTIAFWFEADSFTSGGTDNCMWAHEDTSTDGGDLLICAEVKASGSTNEVSVAFDAHRRITGTSLSTGTWYHLAFVVESGASTTDDPLIYVDGTSESTTNESGGQKTLDTQNAQAWIGDWDANSGFDGRIDEVRLYDRALTSGEISTLAGGGYIDTEETSTQEHSLSSDLDINGDLIIQSGDLSAGSNTINLAGDWKNWDGVFTDGTGTVELDGADTTQIVSGTTEFYNFTANDSTNNSTSHTLTFDEGTTFTIANTLTMDGTDGTNDEVVLNSSDGSTQFVLNITGAQQCVNYVDVSNSDVTGTATYDIYAENSDNTINNDTTVDPSWVFSNCPVTISGSVYTDEGSTKIVGAKTVRLYINGTSDNTDDTSSGDFSITASGAVSANDILTLFIEDETEDGVTVTGATGNDQTGVDIYENYLITRHDNGGSLTNANLDTADGAGSDADITNIYTVDASDNVTVPDGVELYVESGDTYAPGANIIADDIDINGTLTMAANDAEVHGSWDATGGSFSQTGQTMFTSTADETITSNSGSFGDLLINDGLRGYWKLDEGTGTNAADSSGYGNDGTLTNGPAWVNDAGDTAPVSFENPYGVRFDGTDDIITMGTSEELRFNDTPFSASLWIKLDVLEAVHALGNDNVSNGWVLGTNNSDYARIIYRGSPALNATGTTTTLTANKWHNLAATFDGSELAVYLDGVQEDTDSTASTISTESGTMSIGGRASDGGADVDGLIDDVRIYSRVLTADELSALAAGNQPATEDTAASEFSLSGTLDVNGDLILNSGELDADAAITVAGAWHNNGGKFNESTQTVTLDDSTGTNEIQSGGQAFYNLTSAPTGATTYELHDDLTVTNVLSLADSDSAFDGNTYTLWVDDFEQSNGDFTGDNSTVVITSSDNETVSFGTGDDAYHNVHTEDPQENGLVGYWKFDEGQGTTTVDSSSNSNDGTLTNGPLWKNHAHDGLVGYWKFDETSGTTAYDLTGRNDGTHVNTPTISTTTPSLDFTNDRSLEFDGSTEYVNIDGAESTVNSDTAGTISLWVRPQTVDATQTYISFSDTNADTSILVQARSTNVVRLFISDSAQDSSILDTDTAVISNEEWMHIAATQDATAAKLFIDGVEVAQTNSGSAVGKWFNDLTGLDNSRIGNHSFNSTGETQHFDGNIDDVRIYNRALNASEVANIALGKPIDESTFVDFQNPFYIDFDASDDQVLISDTSALRFDAATEDFTLAAWVLLEGDGSDHYVLDKRDGGDDGYRLFIDDGGSSDPLECSVDTVDINSSSSIKSEDGWTHVACVVDRDGDGQIYINGTADGSTTAISSEAMATTTDLLIGDSGPASNGWDGGIDDVRIYDYALSTDEISNLYNGSYASNTPDEDLVGWWKFDDTADTSIAIDSSKNANSGTLTNMEAGDWDTSTKATLDYTNTASLSFDGTDEFVDVSDDSTLDLSTAGTISVWARSTDWTQTGMFASKYLSPSSRSYYLAVVSDKARWLVSSTGSNIPYRDSSSSLSDSTWHHIVGVFNGDNTTLDVYIDGALDNGTQSGTIPSSLYNSTTDVNLGDREDSDAAFNGHLDDVRIYDRALSVGEIEQLASGGTIDAIITLDTTLDVNSDLHLHSGALDANSSENNNQTVAGDFNNNDLFIPRTSTTTLDGADQQVMGSTTFSTLSKSESSDDEDDDVLTFEASKLFTILSTLTLQGIDNTDRINILSDTSGTKATLNPTGGDQSVSWVDVSDSESSTYDILGRRSVDTSNTDTSEASPHWILRGLGIRTLIDSD